MSYDLIASEKTAVEVPARPVFERLPVDPFVPCDGHASQAIQALVTMLTPEGHEIYLCGNCARKSGYEHTAHVTDENRQQGSDH
jgi:hypothetical protein